MEGKRERECESQEEGQSNSKKSVNPSIHFLLRFQCSQSFPGRQRRSGPPPSCSFHPGEQIDPPGLVAGDGWAGTEQRCVASFTPQQKKER